MRILVSVLAIALSTAAYGNEQKKGVGYCSQFLPEGKTYTYTVEGSIQRTKQSATISNKISVSGPMVETATGATREEAMKKLAAADTTSKFSKEIEPFQK